MNKKITIKAIATPCKHEHTTNDKKFHNILNGVYQKKINSVPFSNSYSLKIDLNKTIVTASLKIPSPNTIEYNLGNLFEEIASYEAIVSILQKQAPSSRISHIESSLIILISLASLTRSLLININILSWLAQSRSNTTTTKNANVPTTPKIEIYDKFFTKAFFLRLKPAAKMIGGYRIE